MAEKKPTTKAHRGFIHIRKRGAGTRPRRRRPRIPRFPFGRGRLGPADEPLDRRGRPIRSPIQGGRRRLPIGIRPYPGMNLPTVEPQPIRRKKDRRFFDRPTVPDRLPPLRRRPPMSPEEKALLKRQLDEVARRRGIRRNRRTPQITAGLGSLGSSIFNRATRAQRRAKGGMIFKSKDYVNPSNTVDNKKK
tara:strand:- start:16 stop:588 length:573 start_codon:yes stop_codon:yes gene_type:complete